MGVARWTLRTTAATVLVTAVVTSVPATELSSPARATHRPRSPEAAFAARGPRGVALPAPGAVARRRVGRAPALPPGTVALGPVPAGQRLQVEVSLRPRDPAALASFVRQVSTPGSPEYRHYLAKGQFGSAFGPAGTTVVATVAALRADGLSPGTASADGLLVPASGTAAAVEAAFSTSLYDYRLPDGTVGFANTEAPSVPAAIAPQVQGVVGLENLSRPRPAIEGGDGMRAPAAAPQPEVGPGTCNPAASVGLTANQLAQAYGLDGLYAAGATGSGTTVALYELSDYISTDVAQYQACYGTDVTVTAVGPGGDNSINDGQLEADADTELVTSLAPGSSVRVYEYPDTAAGPTQEWEAIVDDDLAKVVSTSWGACEPVIEQAGLADVEAEDTLFEQAAAQGQTVLAASGDYGAEGCPPPFPFAKEPAVIDPASQPYVTGVGGTTLESTASPPSETAWNLGGGGVSDTWQMPVWQAGAGIPSPQSSSSGCAPNGTSYPSNGSWCREVPDVSANAGKDEAVYASGAWLGVQGTSLAAPLWGALLSAVDQTCALGPVGFANPALYAIGDGPGSGMNDVTTDSNGPNGDPGYAAGPGYDMVSGLGSPDASLLAPLLCPPTVTGVSPPNGSVAGGTTVTIHGSGFSALPGATSFGFGTSAATDVACASSTECTASAPPGASPGSVAVSAAVGGSKSSTNGSFDYVTPSDFDPVAPTRIVDTRSGSGSPYAGRTLGPGETLDVEVAQPLGVPASQISAVVLNVTVTDTTSASYLTAYPTGASRPLASNLNWGPGQTLPNLVEVALGDDGSVSFFNDLGNADLVVDVEGYVGTSETEGDALTPRAPTRIVDTRSGSGSPYAGRTLGPGETLDVNVAEALGVSPSQVSAVVMNVTVTDTTSASYLTAYPAGGGRPLASNLNWIPGETVPNRVVVQVPTSGQMAGHVELFNALGQVDVVVDVNGYYPPSAGPEGFNGNTPARIVDTRSGSGSPYAGRTLGPGGTLDVDVAGHAGVPPGAKAVVVNVTVTDTTSASYLTVYPGNLPSPPLASDLNWDPGATVANLVVTELGSNGDLRIYNQAGNLNVVVDVVGWYS
jgi:hypothetical protein